MRVHDRTIRGVALAALGAVAVTVAWPAQASDAGWFIGGMLTSRVINNMERRTRAQEAQAYRPPPQPVQHAPAQAPASKPSKEQQLQQLDKLAAGGYITPEEYKARRKAILDSM